MTHKVFWDNPYQTELTSTVTSVEDNQIQLAETIFYAESGGQESDTGTIGGIAVSEARKQGKSIIYTLESPPTFHVGDSVVTLIDWSRRYALMKLHFAAELVLELFTKDHPEITKIGAHISADKSRIDFEWPESITPLLADIEQQAQALIDMNLEIESTYLDRTEERRYWKIKDFAQVPCGGTHLKQTSEVGQIQLKRKNPGKGKERVEIRLLEA